MTVLPAIHTLGARRRAQIGKNLRIGGSGFSREPSANIVWVGATPCSVISAAPNEIICNVGTSLGAGAPSAMNATPTADQRSWNGPGLSLTQRHLNSSRRGCITDIMRANSSDCAADDSTPTLVNLRQQVVFPHHTSERHDVETGKLLVTRAADVRAVLVSTTAWFVPPSDGTYELSLQPGLPCILELGELGDQHGSKRQRGCQSGQRALEKGRRYPFRLAVVLGNSNAQLVLSATVNVGRGSWHLPAPADWFEAVVAVPPDGTPIVSVAVNGLQSVCRTVGGCAITVVPAEMELSPTPERHRMLTTLALHGTGSNGPLPSGGSWEATMSRTAPKDHGISRRQLLEGCPSDCCVVIYRGAPGEYCDPVPLWDFSSWAHPGGPFVQASTLCGTVRYSWLSRSGQHVLQQDPQASGRACGSAVRRPHESTCPQHLECRFAGSLARLADGQCTACGHLYRHAVLYQWQPNKYGRDATMEPASTA